MTLDPETQYQRKDVCKSGNVLGNEFIHGQTDRNEEGEVYEQTARQ